MTRVLHADLDAFYASVEQRDRPALRGRPIAVGAGVVLAASYEARRFGVRTPMPLRQARALCPSLRVVEPRMEAYAEASTAVFAVFDDTSPIVEPLSIDEAFLDITGLARLAGEPDRHRLDTSVATELRRRVAAEVGLPLSVGGASTKFLAKVASSHSKPDGLLIVRDGAELDFLHPLPVARLWGVGPVTASRLQGVGIETVGEVAALDVEVLVTKVGRAAGRHLHALANNRDPRTVVVGRRRRSIGSQRSFPAGTVDGREARVLMLDIVERVCARLRRAHRLAHTVTARARYDDFAVATRSRTLTLPTNATATVLDVARPLVDAVEAAGDGRHLTRIGLSLSGLVADDALQLPLPFTKADRHRLDDAVDDIRNRFGDEAMTRGPLLGRRSVNVPLLPD